MPQQINLCTPILLTQRRYFSAQTMVQALALFLVVGGGLAAYWVWSLRSSSEGFKKAVSAHERELATLQTALLAGRAGATTADAGLAQELLVRRTDVVQREALLGDLRRGMFKEGWGQSARLQLVAQSIPAQVWVTDVKANDIQLDVSGFTLEPAALNEWVKKLATSPLLQGQKLATIKVERVERPTTAAAVASATASSQRPVWSFSLVSAMGSPGDIAGKNKP
jgi:Tfp pilus assembly protein PilN